jgi:hypothetical protein
MVNLLSRLPFNLHNRNLSACLDPSSSRSASDSLLASPASPRYPSYAAHFLSNFHDAKDDYASRSPSIAAPNREPCDEQETDQGSSREEEEEEEDRTPIFSLRLVSPKYGIGMGRPLVRGRSQPKRTPPETQDGEEVQRDTSPGVGEPLPTSPEQEDVLSPTSTVVPKESPVCYGHSYIKHCPLKVCF